MAGIYDVVKDYSWTSIPPGTRLRKEAPSALVTSYELEESQLRAFVSGFINVYNKGSQDPMKFYDQLYKVKSGNGSSDGPTRYRFPYFGDSFRSYVNNYADTFSQISSRGAQMLGAKPIMAAGDIADEVAGLGGVVQATQNQALMTQFDNAASVVDKAAKNVLNAAGINSPNFEFRIPRASNPGEYPGTYIEHPIFYQFANTDSGVEITFILANTIDRRDIKRNQKLIKTIMEESRPERGSSIEMTFPRIYEIKVPGLRYIRWAFLANASFNLLGQRRIAEGTKQIVPEAYGISLTFNSLTIEVANFIERAEMV